MLVRNALILKIKYVVEAAGVEPASEKARHEETTCVAGLKIFGGGPEIRRE